MNSAEFERKQREFMEQAVKMAERAGKGRIHEPVKEEPKAEMPRKEDVFDKAEELFDEVTEELSKAVNSIEEEDFGVIREELKEEKTAEPYIEETEEKEEISFGVFDKDELIKAIESGEVSEDSLKQASEILEEMNSKTEAMKKLLEEQECRYGKKKNASNGGDYGLNGYIDRHNNSCRGCSDGNGNSSSR